MHKANQDEILKETFGIWKDIKVSSVDYVRALRKESKGRMKRLKKYQ